MNKITFMEALKQGLKKYNVKDIDEILEDYEDYFYHQIKQGRSEEETALKLGDVNKIIEDYKSSTEGKKRKWFDLVSISFIAIPLLVSLYGLLVVFIASALAFWATAIYYLFQLDTFLFMPAIPIGVHLLYVITLLAWAVFFFSLSVRFAKQIKSMTMQYLVKQTIRIGDYQVKSIYTKMFKYGLATSILMLVLTYIISVIIAKDFQFWHVWEWFI